MKMAAKPASATFEPLDVTFTIESEAELYALFIMAEHYHDLPQWLEHQYPRIGAKHIPVLRDFLQALQQTTKYYMKNPVYKPLSP